MLCILKTAKVGEDFHFELRGLEATLDKTLVKIGLLHGLEAQSVLEKAGVSYRHICQDATTHYHDLLSTVVVGQVQGTTRI